jgi:TonB family protein
MSAFTQSRIAVALLTATLAIAQDAAPTEPKVVSRVEPTFQSVPTQAVRLRVFIDWKGNAKKIIVLEPYDPKADEAALTVVQNWRFQPGTKNGIPIDSTLVVSFPAN